MARRLKYLVIHCTATPAGRDVTSDDIRRWHTLPEWAGGRGWKQVGYTDLFHLDGSVERLVDNNEDAWVDPWEVTNGAKGHNSVSRHIVYAGGLDIDGNSCDTRTAKQKAAMAAYVRDFHTRFPGVKILGHRDLSPDRNGDGKISSNEWLKDCPCFDVAAWLREIGIDQRKEVEQ